MAPENSNNPDREERLNAILASWLEAAESGQVPDEQEFVARYPEFAQELSQHLATWKRFAPIGALPSHDRGVDTPRSPTPSRGALSASGASYGPGSADTAVCGSPDPAHDEFSFADYELLEILSQGGMGVVYKARQKNPNRLVALKMIRPGRLMTAEDVQRFRNEAELVAQLDHPNLVPIYEVGEWRGLNHGQAAGVNPAILYFSMKLMEGGSLAKAVTSGQWPATSKQQQRQAAQILVAIARAIHHAHQRGILHRDLKPSNVLLDADGRPHVSDFGLGKRVTIFGDRSPDVSLTETGAIVGTPQYMSPEQAGGVKGAITTATDVYGLGTILYALLTGRPPFQEATPLDTLLRVKEREPDRPSSVNPRVDRDLETICLKCLEKEPAKRYGSALALAEDLERFLAGKPIQARPLTRAARLHRWCRRNPVVATLSSATGTLIVAAVTWLIISLALISNKEKATNKALQEAETNYRAAEEQRREARKAVDTMYTQVAEKWLNNQPGMEELQREFLTAALDFYQQFSQEESDEPEHRFQTALAYQRVARIQQMVFGESSKAESALLQAIGILEKLSQESSKEPDYVNELARCYLLLGWARTGNVQEEERWIRRGVELWEELVAAFPANRTYRRQLGTGLLNLAGPVGSMGRQNEAENICRRAITVMEEAPTDVPRSALETVTLAVSYDNLGESLEQAGRLQEALDSFQKSIELHLPLAGKNPDVPQYDLGLRPWDWINFGNLHSKVGNLLRRTGRCEEGRPFVERGIRIHERLVASFPKTGVCADLLHEDYLILGRLELASRQTEAANRAYNEALRIAEQLCRPPSITLAKFLLICPDAKFRDAARALDILEKIIAMKPENRGTWKYLALARYGAGNYRQALEAVKQAQHFGGPGNCAAGFFQAMAHWQLGEKEKASQCYHEAAQWLEKSYSGDEELCLERDQAAALLEISKIPRDSTHSTSRH